MKWNESGVEITVNSDGRFVATVGESHIFENSLTAARDRVTALVKSVAKARKLSIPVVGIRAEKEERRGVRSSHSVQRTTLIGVNRTTRDLMVSTPGEWSRLMPDTPENRALLDLHLLAQAEAARLNTLTGIHLELGYGRIEAGDYEEVLARVERGFTGTAGE